MNSKRLLPPRRPSESALPGRKGSGGTANTDTLARDPRSVTETEMGKETDATNEIGTGTGTDPASDIAGAEIMTTTRMDTGTSDLGIRATKETRAIDTSTASATGLERMPNITNNLTLKQICHSRTRKRHPRKTNPSCATRG